MDTLVATHLSTQENLRHRENSPPKSRKMLRRFLIAAAILTVIAFFAGFLPRLRDHDLARLDNAELGLRTVAVIHAEPAPSAPSLLLSAELRPYVETPIYARANGYLKKRFVDIGSAVKKGDPLAQLDTPELDQELERTKADLAQTKAAMDLAKTTAARYRDLLKTSSVSDQDAAEKEADLASKNATYESAAAHVRQLEELKSFDLLTAPFDGKITVRSTDVGDLVTAASGRALFSLADTRTLRVFVHVPQSIAFDIRPGMTADLVVSEKPGQHFTARVIRTAGAIDINSRTLLTELEVDNHDDQLFAGSFAQLRLEALKSSPLLTIPGNAVLFRAEGMQVAIVNAENKVELRSFKPARDLGNRIEIAEGVSIADRVILNPPDSLTAGATVRTSEPGAAAKEAK